MEALFGSIFDYAERRESRAVFWTIVVATFVIGVAGALISIDGWWDISPWVCLAWVVATFDLEIRGKRLCVINDDDVRETLYDLGYLGGIFIYIALRIMQ